MTERLAPKARPPLLPEVGPPLLPKAGPPLLPEARPPSGEEARPPSGPEARPPLLPEARPRLAPGVRLREDATRGWIVVAPERVFVPDDIALEVLRLVDGTRDLAAIVGILAARFAAPHAEIEGDVAELLTDLVDRGVLRT